MLSFRLQDILKRFIKAQQEFAELPAAQQPEVMSDISGLCMYDMLHYAYEHLAECKLILCCSEGTKFARLIDEMVEIEVEWTHAYQAVSYTHLSFLLRSRGNCLRISPIASRICNSFLSVISVSYSSVSPLSHSIDT